MYSKISQAIFEHQNPLYKEALAREERRLASAEGRRVNESNTSSFGSYFRSDGLAPSAQNRNSPSRDNQETPAAPKPGKLYHPTPETFEELCRDWCHYLGYLDATKTQNTKDGGIDIKSQKMIAQVKFQVSPVGVRPIRELNGVRRPGQEVLFFSLNGYTPEAKRESSEMGITLIRVYPLEGKIEILA